MTRIKKSNLSVFIFSILFILTIFHPAAVRAGVPHVVYGNLTNSDGSIPPDGTIRLKAYISERPDEILTESGVGCGYQNGLWWVEVGNFQISWSVGEILHVSATHTATNKSDTANIILNGSGNQRLSLSIPPQDANPSPSYPSFNNSPQANAGADQTVKEGTSVILDGSESSDPDGNYISYSWEQTEGPTIELSDNTAQKPSFIAPEVGSGGDTLKFKLTVRDSHGASSSDTCVINIIDKDTPAENFHPLVNAGDDQSVYSGAIVTLDGSASSDFEDGTNISYLWEQTEGTIVELSDQASPTPTFTAPQVVPEGESLVFRLTVTDTQNAQSSDKCTVTVTALTQDNQPPRANAGSDQTVNVGDTVMLDGSASSDDEDGTALNYLWEQTDGTGVVLSDSNAVRPVFIAPDADVSESLSFRLTVTDSGGLTSVGYCIVNVTPFGTQNTPPVANAGSNQTVTEATTVMLDASASYDSDGDTLFYKWTQTDGRVVVLRDISSTNPTFLAPPVSADGDVLTFRLTVEDSEGLKSNDEVSVVVQDNGLTGFPDDVYTFMTSTGKVIGVQVLSGGDLSGLSAMSVSDFPNDSAIPEDMIYGISDVQIKTDAANGEVQVAFYLPESAPDTHKWYGQNSSWDELGATFDQDRTEVIVTLSDGASEDQESESGTLVLYSGLGYLADSSDSGNETGNSGGGDGDDGGCFINTTSEFSEPGKACSIVFSIFFMILLLNKKVRLSKKGYEEMIKKMFSVSFPKMLGIFLMIQVMLTVGFSRVALADSFTFELKAGLNAISVPFEDAGINTAEELAAAIPNCSATRYWDAENQKYIEYLKDSAENNFSITPGMPYVVNIETEGQWEVSGGVIAHGVFSPVRNEDITNINMIAVPLDEADITNAEELANSIDSCDTVWYWDVEKQGYVGHPKGTEINNFEVKPGYSYFVSVEEEDKDQDGYRVPLDCDDTNPDIHPGAAEICGDNIDQNCDGIDLECGVSDNAFTVLPNENLTFTVSLSEAAINDLVSPLTFSITEVKKGNDVISTPTNVSFETDTGIFSWTPTADQIGSYEFEFTITDAQEPESNVVEKIIYITVGDISKRIKNITATPMFIEPVKGEQSVISFDLDTSANVTVDIYKAYVEIDSWGDGQFHREFLMTLVNNKAMEAGENTVVWDGKDSGGNILEPSAYVFVITADTGDKEPSVYGLQYYSGSVDITNTSISPQNYNSYSNQMMEVTYDLFVPAWVTIGGWGMRGFLVMGAPRDKGVNTEKWDGKNQLGELIPPGDVQLAAKTEILPENTIVIKDSSASLLTDVLTEAYVIVPAYGEISTVKYTLTSDASVSISISDPNGNKWTLADSQAQTAGEHTIEWHGDNSDGKMVWPGSPESPEGDYTVEITATDSANSDITDTRRANIHVYR